MHVNEVLLFLLALSKAKNKSIAEGEFVKNINLGWSWHLNQIKRKKTRGNIYEWDNKLNSWFVMINIEQMPEYMWLEYMAKAVDSCVYYPNKSLKTTNLEGPGNFVKDLYTVDMNALIVILKIALSKDWLKGEDLSNHLPIGWMNSRPSMFKGISELEIDKSGLEIVMNTLIPNSFAAETGHHIRESSPLK